MISGGRQPSRGSTSRMDREVHLRIFERLGLKFPGPTRHLCHDTASALTAAYSLTDPMQAWRGGRKVLTPPVCQNARHSSTARASATSSSSPPAGASG